MRQDTSSSPSRSLAPLRTWCRARGQHELRAWPPLLALAALLIGAPVSQAAEPLPELATLELAIPGDSAEVVIVSELEEIAELYRECFSLPPSDSGFPRWIVHFWVGPERLRSCAVIPSDLQSNPALRRTVGQLGADAPRFVYSLSLPVTYVERGKEAVSRLRDAGFRPLFHKGERNNWPYVEVVLSETVGAGGDRDAPVDSEAEAEERQAFAERLGPLLRGERGKPEQAAAYRRLEAQLYRHHRALTNDPEMREFHASYRRYRWQGNSGKSRVAVLARYTARTQRELDALATYLEGAGAERLRRGAPRAYVVELLSEAPRASQLEPRLATLFPDLRGLRLGHAR